MLWTGWLRRFSTPAGRGVCGTCRARLGSGRVDPGVPFALTEDEQDSGMILTCVARPLSAEVVLRPPD